MTTTQYIFQFLSGKYDGGRYSFPDKTEFSLGRDAEADLVLVEDMVSRFHAKISVIDKTVFIEDTNSSNGTYVNGQKINEPKALNTGDKLLIGKSILRFCTDADLQLSPPVSVITNADDFDAISPSSATRAFSIDYLEQIVAKNKKQQTARSAMARLKTLFPDHQQRLTLKAPLENRLNDLSSSELKWLQDIWNATNIEDLFAHTSVPSEEAAHAILNLWDKGFLMSAT